MIQAEVSLIAQIELKTNTYYITDRDGVDLDGVTYSNVVLSWGDLPFWGNLGNGESQIGSMDIAINNGEVYQSGGYVFDPTDTWNNGEITIRRWKNVTTHRFSEATFYAVGIIKNFRIEQTGIFFTVDVTNRKDDKLIPGIVGEDQTDLTDAEAKTTFFRLGNQNAVSVTDISLFDIGELVKLSAPSGETEYQRVLDKQSSTLIFYDNLAQLGKYSHSAINIIQKGFREIPKKFIGKAIPVQIGDLSRHYEGVFGKTFTIGEKIGSQAILTDCISGYDVDSIGVWERGSTQYFKGRQYTTSDTDGEYAIQSDYKSILFSLDTETTLLTDITTTSEGIDTMLVSDYSKLNWIDEDSVPTWETTPELLGVNIISVNSELMLVVSKPVASEIFIERGYNNTTITTHSAGASVYQSAKFSSKNLLTFTERFSPVAAGNFYYYDKERDISSETVTLDHNLLPTDVLTNGYSNIFDTKDTTYSGFDHDIDRPASDITEERNAVINYDVKFKNYEETFTVYGVYFGGKLDNTIAYQNAVGTRLKFTFSLWNSSKTTTRDQIPEPDEVRGDISHIILYDSLVGQTVNQVINENTLIDIDRTSYSGSYSQGFNPDLFTGSNLINTLNDLRKKFKIVVHYLISAPTASTPTIDNVLNLYEFGLWVDFFIDFTKDIVVAPLKARKITATVAAIVGTMSPDVVGDMAENIVDVLALLLSQEMRYSSDDFTDNWQTVKDYTINSSNYEVLSPTSPTPEAAFSYGIEDKQKRGWDFVTWLASHFNLQVFKDYEGKIEIANLHQIYNNTPTGSEIKIEHIIFLVGSGNREISIHQTGTDLIFNDIIIKWKRNNSTDEYQEVYKLPDSYTIVKSGITLAVARTDYYGGEKRTLEIESPFIYNKADAKRLAEAKADDQAETHFFVDFNIDFEHYTNINSLSNQYKIGDIIYLTGEHGGVTFTSSRKFYIQNTILIDSGRKIKIQAKSVDPISSF